METYKLKDNIKVMGVQVKSFPKGVGEAFDKMVNTLPDGFNRAFYGLSHMDKEGKIVYIAAAEEKHEGEAEKYNWQQYVIEKGEYLAVTVRDWMKNIDCIKDTFHDMMKDERADCSRPCVEWYKSDDEMVCMVACTSQNLVATIRDFSDDSKVTK